MEIKTRRLALIGGFARRQGFHYERMDRARQFFFENVIDHPLARHPPKTFKRRSDDPDAKMRFAAFPGARVTGMQMRLIHDHNLRRLKRSRQF
jgi:hypothetical protein